MQLTGAINIYFSKTINSEINQDEIKELEFFADTSSQVLTANVIWSCKGKII